MNVPALHLQGIACTFVSKDVPGQRYTAVRKVTRSWRSTPTSSSWTSPSRRYVQTRQLMENGLLELWAAARGHLGGAARRGAEGLPAAGGGLVLGGD